jgi:hypothetical protein
VSISTPSCVPAHLHSAPIKGLYDKLWWLHRPFPGTESPTPHSLGSYVRPAPPPSSLFGQATKGSHETASRGITDDPPLPALLGPGPVVHPISEPALYEYTRALRTKHPAKRAFTSDNSTPRGARAFSLGSHINGYSAAYGDFTDPGSAPYCDGPTSVAVQSASPPSPPVRRHECQPRNCFTRCLDDDVQRLPPSPVPLSMIYTPA